MWLSMKNKHVLCLLSLFLFWFTPIYIVSYESYSRATTSDDMELYLEKIGQYKEDAYNAVNLYTQNDIGYISDLNNGVSIVNMTDLSNISKIIKLEFGSGSRTAKIDIKDDLLITAAHYGGICIFNISNIENVTFCSRYCDDGDGSLTAGASFDFAREENII